MSESLASELAGAAERLVQAARAVERHLLTHGALTDPVDQRSDEDKFDAQGNLRVQGHGGGTPPGLDDVGAALAEVTAAHAALDASLAGTPPAPPAAPVGEA